MLSEPLSSTIEPGVVTTFVPIAEEVSVHCAPGTPGVLTAMDCVVPLVMVAQPARSVTATESANETRRMTTEIPHT